MTTSIWLRDIGALVLQLGLVIGTGAVLSRLFRLADPRATLAYWRSLLLVGLLLPVFQPWRIVASPPVAAPIVARAISVDAANVSTVPTTMREPAPSAWTPGDIVLSLLAAGIREVCGKFERGEAVQVGAELIAACPVVLYTGSLVPREVLAHAQAGARVLDSSSLTLEQIIDVLVAARNAVALDLTAVNVGVSETLETFDRR